MDPLIIVISTLISFYTFIIIIKGVTMYTEYRERQQIIPITSTL